MIKPDQERPASGFGYDAAIALQFFKSAGNLEAAAPGATIFAESEKGNPLLFKRNKMYLLLDGEVSLSVKNKVIGSVRTGEIFGEMASINQMPRSASAVAKTACRVISLDDKQFQSALRKKPEFALMMMGIVIGRLRGTIARLRASDALSAEREWKETRVFDKKLLGELTRELAGESPVEFRAEKVIMSEGQVGVLMYVVLQGRVAVSIQGKLVEKIGPGGVFGEMALVDKSPRLASAVAETDCTLLGIHRNAFLDLMKTKPEFGLSLLSAMGERARFMAAR